MTRRYYSSRTNPKALTIADLYWKLQNLYLMFLNRDYFKRMGGITSYGGVPTSIEYEAALALKFQPFPINDWEQAYITEDNIFDTIEFLYDHVSQPGEKVDMTSDTVFHYVDYDHYDDKAGRTEFRQKANDFLRDYKPGYELAQDGHIQAIGTEGLQYIIDAEIPAYDEANVDGKVRNAVAKWRSRHSTLVEKKEAIRELADVFEWLKKDEGLANVLDKKDDSAIFDIANSFAIRHHNTRQKANYDKAIWYSWMFHFYLATYHAVIRLLLKEREQTQNHGAGH